MTEPRALLDAVRQWVEHAEHDLINARHTLTLGEDCPFDTVCFHAQQCAEKYLKALLTYTSVPFPKIHDLTEIIALVPPGLLSEVESFDLEELTPYAVETRYAGFRDDFSREEAEEAVENAERVRRAVLDLLPPVVHPSTPRG